MEQSFLTYCPLPAIWVDQKQMQILGVNDLAAEMLGLGPDKLVGEELKYFVKLNNLQPADQHGIEILSSDNKQLTADAHIRYLEGNESGTLLLTFREADSRYLELMEGTLDGIMVISKTLKMLDVNPAFTKITGIGREEIVGKGATALIQKFLKAKDAKKILPNIKLLAQGKPIEDININFNDKKLKITTWIRKDTKNVIGIVRDVTDEIRAANEIKEREEQFRFLVESSFEGILIHKRGNVVDLNKAFLDMTGYTKEEAIGENILEYVPKSSDRAKILVKMIQRRATPYNISVRRKNGETFLAEIEAREVTYKGKRLRVAALRDVTERMKLQQDLKESEERYRTVFDNTGTATLIIEKDGLISLANSKYAELVGYPLEEIQNKKKWMEFVHPDDLPMMLDRNRRRLQGKEEPREYEFRTKSRTGEIRFQQLYIDVIPGTGKSVASLIDITERKTWENELRDREDKLELAQSIGKIGNWSIYLDEEKFEGSLEAMNIYGTEPGQRITPKNLRDYLLPEYVPLVEGALAKMSFEKNRSDIEFQVRNQKSGKVVDVRIIAESFPEERLIVGVIQDISDRKQAERELLDKNKELLLAKEKAEENERLKSAFLANMSHEIRTPMNGILGFTNLLTSQDLEKDTRTKYLDIIQKSGKRLLSTVNDLIDISRLETGQVKLVRIETHINEQLDNLYQFFKQECDVKNLKLRLHKSLPNKKALIWTDEQKLNSILTNLIKNAVKYTHEGGIEFGYDLKEFNGSSVLEYFVKDTGIGIPQDRQEAVFNRFEQADVEDREVYEGSGLGLAIAKNLVELLGGSISLSSREGQGSAFRFTCPYNAVEEERVDESDDVRVSDLIDIPGELKLLIAEDDRASFLHLSILLKSVAKEIIHAENGTEAVELCRSNPDLDLVLMDIKMPGINGLEATSQIREFNPGVPIIAQTAYALSGDRERAIEAGCTDYVTKPLSKDLLFLKIQCHVAARS